MIFTIKCIGNGFYYKNTLEMIFTIKMHRRLKEFEWTSSKFTKFIIFVMDSINIHELSKNSYTGYELMYICITIEILKN